MLKHRVCLLKHISDHRNRCMLYWETQVNNSNWFELPFWGNLRAIHRGFLILQTFRQSKHDLSFDFYFHFHIKLEFLKASTFKPSDSKWAISSWSIFRAKIWEQLGRLIFEPSNAYAVMYFNFLRWLKLSLHYSRHNISFPSSSVFEVWNCLNLSPINLNCLN